MRDYLAWRLAFGVTTPSTNTVVQPEYDDMRPAGVTNHLARMVIPDMAIRNNDDFDESIRLIDASLEDAVGRAMDAKPNAFILGISALSIWGGTPEWGEDLKRRIRKVAQSDIPVALASDAVIEGLKRHGVKKKIAVMEPYYPSIESRMRGVLGPHGYEIVRFNHMRGKSPASYSNLTARDMIEAMKAIDGPDIEASPSSSRASDVEATPQRRRLAGAAGHRRAERQHGHGAVGPADRAGRRQRLGHPGDVEVLAAGQLQ